MPEISLKKKYETFAVVANVLQIPQNLVISGRFAEDGCKGLKRSCTAIVLSHKNFFSGVFVVAAVVVCLIKLPSNETN